MNLLLFLSIILVTRTATAKNVGGILSSCNQPDCMRCDLRSTQCVKCLHVMVVGNRECHNTCPFGYDAIWADDPNIFGRICRERSILSMVSYREVGVITGASVIGVISIAILLGIFLLRNKGSKPPPDFPPRGLPKSLQDKRPKTAEVAIKGKEREEFITRLRSLRADAPHIMQMITVTRNRYKSNSSVYWDNPSDTKTKACKAVVRDLGRVLCLLSLKEEHMKTGPKDWRSLLSWTERLLTRYKRQESGLDVRDSGRSSTEKYKTNHLTSGKENRTLYISRQDKVKMEQEKRRLAQQLSVPEPQFNENLTESQFYQNIQLYNDNYKEDCKEKAVIKEYWVSAPVKDETRSMKILAVKNKEDFSTSVKKAIKKLLSNFLTIKQTLLSIFSLKRTENNDPEKGITVTDGCTNKDILFSESDDDIASQMFFDHIEGFTFDPLSELEFSIEKKPDPKLLNTNKHSIGRQKNKFLSDVSCKNFMNSWKRGQDLEKLFIKENFKKHSKKVSRPSCKIKKLSSNLLSKERNSVNEIKDKCKIRRPLKRQKQVEKSNRSKILQKYKNKDFEKTFTSDQTDSNEDHNYQISNNDRKELSYQSSISLNFKTKGKYVNDLITSKWGSDGSSYYESLEGSNVSTPSCRNIDVDEFSPSNENKNWLKHHTKLEIVTCV